MISSVDTSTGSARRLYRTCWSEVKVKRRPYPVSATQLSSRHPGNEVAVSTTYWHLPVQGEKAKYGEIIAPLPHISNISSLNQPKNTAISLGTPQRPHFARLLPAVQGRREADSVASQGGFTNPGRKSGARFCWWKSAFSMAKKNGDQIWFISWKYMGISWNINEYMLYVSRIFKKSSTLWLWWAGDWTENIYKYATKHRWIPSN